MFTDIIDIEVNIDSKLTLMLIFICGTLFTYKLYKSRMINEPPGPKGIPVFGNWFSLGPRLHESFAKWSKVYGNIIKVRIGMSDIVVLGDIDIAKEAFIKNGDVFSNRPEKNLIEDKFLGKGVVFSNGQIWKEHRRFALHVLRDLGMGKMSLEKNIQDEIDAMLAKIEEQGSRFDIHKLIMPSVSNVICSLVFGKRYDHSDPKFNVLLHNLTEFLKYITRARYLIRAFPFLEKLPGKLFGLNKLRKIDRLRVIDIQDQIHCHRNSNCAESPRDYIEAFLDEMGKQKQKFSDNTTFTDEQLQYTCRDFFNAGSETTATVLCWSIVYMLHYPDIQEKIQTLIEKEVGHKRLPSLKDRNRLTFVEATLNEIIRCSSMVPLNVDRSTTEDIILNGYLVKAHTTVTINISAVHNDPKYWKHPERFDPDRFLDPKGKLIKPHSFIPFGLGKRSCLGESLAKMELFLFFTAMLQKFTFLPHEKEGLPSTNGTYGFVHLPNQFTCQAIKRKQVN